MAPGLSQYLTLPTGPAAPQSCFALARPLTKELATLLSQRVRQRLHDLWLIRIQ